MFNWRWNACIEDATDCSHPLSGTLARAFLVIARAFLRLSTGSKACLWEPTASEVPGRLNGRKSQDEKLPIF